MQIGFIGIGKMGAPMALRLAGAGHDVRIHDASQAAMAPLGDADGITIAPTLADAATGSEIVVTMLPDGKIVRGVAEQLATMMPDNAILVDMSTSYPLETTDLRDALPDRLGLVDAPVSGGVWRAELGTLTIIAGGETNMLDRVEPALSAMGDVVRCGGLDADR